jgi:filamentous hemagglutinin family protein
VSKSLKYLLCTSAASFVMLTAAPSMAAPQGGSVAAGSATIRQSGVKTDIHQSTNKAIIDWRSFDIRSGEHTQFHQPSSTSVTLNRINDVKASQIDGKLTANGHIMLINPNGVVFGGGAQVDVGSLTATSADIDNADFMAGNYNFDKAGNASASIINNGLITAKEAGLVNLVAPRVENNGVIYAKMGKVRLAAADKFTLDLAGDNLINIAVSDEDAAKIVKNTGNIDVEGGAVALTAAKARNIVDNMVMNSGVITASSMTKKGGKIILGASNVKVSGTLKADGKTGGGEILVGGDYQGAGADVMPIAQNTIVTKNATITANATDTGDGGKVIVWADQNTGFAGSIEANGGTNGGNGGLAEVSGKSYLDFRGYVSLVGDTLGTLLLDPDDLDIVAGAANPAEMADDFVTFAENGGGTSTIGADTLAGRLSANANVILQANNTIDVDAAITSTGDGDLTLQTGLGGTITVNQAIDVNTGDLTLEADNMAINADLSGSGDLTVRQVDTSPRQTEINSGWEDGSSLHLSTTEVGHFVDGWNQINFGRSDMASTATSSRIDVGRLSVVTFNDSLNFIQRTNIDALTVQGGSNISGNIADLYGGVVSTNGGAFIASGSALYGAGGTLNTSGGDFTVNGLFTWNAGSGLTVNTSGGNISVTNGIGEHATPSGVRVFDLNAGAGDITIGGKVNTQASVTLNAANVTLNDVWGDSVTVGDVDITASNTSSLVDITAQNITLGGAGTFSSGGSNAALTTATGGALTLNAALNTGAGDLTIKTDAIAVNANLSGSGDLLFVRADETQDMELGGTSHGATWQMETAELAAIQEGFNSITFGSSTHTGGIIFTGTSSFSDDVTFRQDQTNAVTGISASGSDRIITTDGADASFYGDTSYDWTNIDANISGDALFDGFNNIYFRDLDIGRNLTVQNMGNNVALHSGSDHIVGGDVTFDSAGLFFTGSLSPASLQTDGDITIISDGVAIDSTTTISGNADGSSNLTFLEHGEDADMEIGGTAVGSTWQMQDSEFAAIQNGFNTITFGSASQTGDISIQSLDISGLSADIEVYGNDIDLGGLTWGAGDVTLISATDIIVNTAIGNSGAGGDAYLVAGNNFINTAGASGIDVGAGARYLVYAAAPLNITDGGLTADYLYNRTYAVDAPASISAAFGSRFVVASAEISTTTNPVDALTPTVQQQIDVPDVQPPLIPTLQTVTYTTTNSSGETTETKQHVHFSNGQKNQADHSSKDSGIRLVTSDNIEIREKVVQMFDLCSYDGRYCQ